MTSKRPKKYLTKYRKKVKSYEGRVKKKESFHRALKHCVKGRFSSIKKCAAHHKVAYSTLYTLFTRVRSTRGQVEPTRSHVKWRASVGC